jgi:hypothetical protein
LSAFLAAGACKHAEQGDDSAVKVTNGIEISGYPWVVELDNPRVGTVCSGTFISDTTALTAAHCLDGTAAGGLQFNRTSPKQVFYTGAFGHDAALKATDLAILVFAPGTAPATVQVAAAAPAAGDVVAMVGYGQNDVRDLGSLGVKRCGTNTVVGLAAGFIHLKGLPAAKDEVAPGQQAASAAGDSGGPLFVNAGATPCAAGDTDPLPAIAGVDTGGGVHADGYKHSYYINLASDQSCTMLRTALAGGAAIDPLPTACRTAAVSPTDSAMPPDPQG